jgi:hypothetical protein
MNQDSTKATGLGVAGSGIDGAFVVMATISGFPTGTRRLNE